MTESQKSVRLSGYALHTGVITSVTLTRWDGPIAFARGTMRAELSSLSPVRTDFGVTLSDRKGFEIDLVEHFMAAIGGLGIGGEVLATVEGPELPILDGGARVFTDALTRLEIPRSPGRWAVQKAGRITWQQSVFEFEVADRIEIDVRTEFTQPDMGHQQAMWDGDARSFADDIAPARTFGFASDAQHLWNNGRAGLAALAAKGDSAAKAALAHAVLVFGEQRAIGEASGSPLPNELARHKLLDLIGDLAIYGGPPRGRISALRPGHSATHRIIAEAISLGILSAP